MDNNHTATTQTVVANFLERLAVRDADGVAAFFAEEIDWFVPGDEALPWTGHRSRRSDVADFINTMYPHFVPGASTVQIDKVLVTGGDAVVLGTFTHTALSTGRSWVTPVAMHIEVVDGKIVKLYLYEDTQAVRNAFFD